MSTDSLKQWSKLDICWNIFSKQGNAHDGILEETWKSAEKTVENWIQSKRRSNYKMESGQDESEPSYMVVNKQLQDVYKRCYSSIES